MLVDLDALAAFERQHRGNGSLFLFEAIEAARPDPSGPRLWDVVRELRWFYLTRQPSIEPDFMSLRSAAAIKKRETSRYYTRRTVELLGWTGDQFNSLRNRYAR